MRIKTEAKEDTIEKLRYLRESFKTKGFKSYSHSLYVKNTLIEKNKLCN